MESYSFSRKPTSYWWFMLNSFGTSVLFSVLSLWISSKRELWLATTVAGFLHIVQMFSIPTKLLHSRILWPTATISTIICALVYSGVTFLYFLKITHLPVWLSIKGLPRSQGLVFCPSSVIYSTCERAGWCPGASPLCNPSSTVKTEDRFGRCAAY